MTEPSEEQRAFDAWNNKPGLCLPTHLPTALQQTWLAACAYKNAEIADYKEVLADHDRLVREIDVLINGDKAAKQASLCDAVGQIRGMAAEIDRLRADVAALEASFEVFHAAELRGIKIWQQATGKNMVWPDKGKLTAWLCERFAKAEATNAKLREFIQEYVLCECPQNAVAECCARCLILKGDQAEGSNG